MLVNLVDNWSKALDEGNTVNAVFINFTKAFDKIDHHILLQKYEEEQVSPCLIKWLAYFFFIANRESK